MGEAEEDGRDMSCVASCDAALPRLSQTSPPLGEDSTPLVEADRVAPRERRDHGDAARPGGLGEQPLHSPAEPSLFHQDLLFWNIER